MKLFYFDISDFKFDISNFKKKVDQELLKNETILADEKTCGIFGHLLKQFRMYLLHRNEHETFIYPAEEKIIIELVLNRFNKENENPIEFNNQIIDNLFDFIFKKKLHVNDNFIGTDYTDKKSYFEQIYSNYEEYLFQSNIVDSADIVLRLQKECEQNEEVKKFLNKTEYFVSFKRDGLLEDFWFTWLLKDATIYQVLVNTPMNESFSNDIMPDTASIKIEEKLMCNFFHFNNTDVDQRNPTHVYFLKLILSYLSLLVNSRNELCLASVINVPERGLDEIAFTYIKHEAANKRMSMYQVMVSYVTRVRLGGKGYAPVKGCPLNGYFKGLSDFIDAMNRLHFIVEENEDALQATMRLISCIKNLLISHVSSLNIGKSSIDLVMNSLMHELTGANKEIVAAEIETPTRSAGSGATLRGRITLRLIRNLLDNLALILYYQTDSNSVVSSQNTPLRIPSLVSKFRSPVIQNIVIEEPSINVKPIKKKTIDDCGPLYIKNISPTSPVSTKNPKRKSEDNDFELKKRKSRIICNSPMKLKDVTNTKNIKFISENTNEGKLHSGKIESQKKSKKVEKIKLVQPLKKQVLLKGQTMIASFFNSKN